MPTDTLEHEATNANAGPDGQLSRLDELIARDEAAEAATRAAAKRQQRDGETGRFTSAQEAQRAGQRQTPTEISAKEVRPQPDQLQAGAAASEVSSSAGTQATTAGGKTPGAGAAKQPDQSQQTQQTTQAKNGEEPADKADKRSAWTKENERKDKSWEAINARKAEMEQRHQELELREQQLTARETALRQARPAPKPAMLEGFTAAQYAAAAQDYEARGEFELADAARRTAGELRAQDKAAAEEYARTRGAGEVPFKNGWEALKRDLPEALTVGSAMNRELRALIQSNPGALADEFGPYRAAVLVGRKLVAGLEAEVQKQRVEAAKVPELSKQVETLSARIKELETMLSPGAGDGAPTNRGESGGKPFRELSTGEMERALEREMAAL